MMTSEAKKKATASDTPPTVSTWETPSNSGELRQSNHDERGRFAPGNGYGGRPKGARNKFSEAFISAVADDFAQHGAAIIERVRTEDPVAYLKICASLVPKELTVKADPLEEMSDTELDRYIRQLAAALGLEFGSGDG